MKLKGQLDLFNHGPSVSLYKYNSFNVILMDENLKYIKDKKGILKNYNQKMTLKKAQELISKAFKIEKSKYGWEVCATDENGNISVYFRFGNRTVKKNDNIEDFIKSNWN